MRRRKEGVEAFLLGVSLRKLGELPREEHLALATNHLSRREHQTALSVVSEQHRLSFDWVEDAAVVFKPLGSNFAELGQLTLNLV